jgi:hypothetical protein
MAIVMIVMILMTSMSANAQLNPPMGASQWKYVTPFQYGFVVQDMSFVDNNNGLAVSNTGAIAKTTDAGYSWQYIFYKYISSTNQVTMASFNDVHFVTPSVAYAVAFSVCDDKKHRWWNKLVTTCNAADTA